MSSDFPRRLREPTTLRLFAFSASFTFTPLARRAGAIPKTMPVSPVSASTKPRMRQSMGAAWPMLPGSSCLPQ
jgi:hypothetical protein